MLFIAEIGLNYNGNLNLAYEMIRQAKYANADIVKFQLGWRGGPDEMNYLDSNALNQLKSWSDYFEIELLVSIFSIEMLQLAKNINFKRYKIASRILKDNFKLAEKIVEEEKETIISLGMWDKELMPFTQKNNVRYLWCLSKYPSFPEAMKSFPKDFINSPYTGYSDHTVGIETPLLAIARGAEIIEKHFTLDKSDTTIRDHVLSATPDEFRNLVLLGRDIHKKIKMGI